MLKGYSMSKSGGGGHPVRSTLQNGANSLGRKGGGELSYMIPMCTLLTIHCISWQCVGHGVLDEFT